MKSIDEIIAQCDLVAVATPDNCGRLIGKRRPIADWSKLRSQGLASPDFHLITGPENRPLDGFAVAGEHKGFQNGTLMPAANAGFLAPSEPRTAIVIADALDAQGRAFEEAPRRILARQVERLARHGVTALVATELEFYAFRQSFDLAAATGYRGLTPLHNRHGDNDILVSGFSDDVYRRIAETLARSGIAVGQMQGEGGTGQCEINTLPADPMTAADSHVAFKHIVKSFAHCDGMSVTFLAKPFAEDAGSGGHIHLSLWSADGTSALGQGDTLSEFGRRFLAGLLALTPELTVLHAPYVNSYRRLTPGGFTPLQATWGWDDRRVMVRLLRDPSCVRLEFRLPGADANPYHSVAGTLAAGLAGVEEGMELALRPGLQQQGAGDIPEDLAVAWRSFSRSEGAAAAFGGSVRDHLALLAHHELSASRRIVTAWEVARGFEVA